MKRVKKNNNSQNTRDDILTRRVARWASLSLKKNKNKNSKTSKSQTISTEKKKGCNVNRTMLTHFRNVVRSTLSHQLQRYFKKKNSLFRYCNMHTSKKFLVKPQTLMSLCEIKIVYYHELLLNVKHIVQLSSLQLDHIGTLSYKACFLCLKCKLYSSKSEKKLNAAL